MSNDSTRSTISSLKDGFVEDLECSTSSSISSRCSSSCKSNFSVDITSKEPKNYLVHLEKVKKYKKQLNANDSLEADCSRKKNRFQQFSSQCRRFSSAPVFSTKRLSCKLQSIEENDERDSSSESSVTVFKNLKVKQECEDDSSGMEAMEPRTPRFYEVPPKKVCMRKKTPKINTPGRDEPPDFRQHVDDSWKGDNKRIAIGEKEYILRKVSKGTTSSVSTQINEDFQKELHSTNKQSNHLEAGDSSTISHKQEAPNKVNLPQSVTEDAHDRSLALEPNIIIIDANKERKNKKRKKNNAVGDASSCSGDGSVKDYKSSDTGSLSTIFRQCMGTPRYSINSTPTYVVSTNYSDSTLQNSARKSEIESVQSLPLKYHSNTEFIEREVKTIDPKRSELTTYEDFYEIADVKSYKSMLLDYSSGVTPTRSFPIHFDDLETLETKDQATETATFKEKASELLQSASRRLNYLNRHYKESKVNVLSLSPSKGENVKSASLIDVRKYQQTHINYYMVGSSSESGVVSEADSIVPPEVHSSEIHLNSGEEEEQCCSCFGSLRLL